MSKPRLIGTAIVLLTVAFVVAATAAAHVSHSDASGCEDDGHLHWHLQHPGTGGCTAVPTFGDLLP